MDLAQLAVCSSRSEEPSDLRTELLAEMRRLQRTLKSEITGEILEELSSSPGKSSFAKSLEVAFEDWTQPPHPDDPPPPDLRAELYAELRRLKASLKAEIQADVLGYLSVMRSQSDKDVKEFLANDVVFDVDNPSAADGDRDVASIDVQCMETKPEQMMKNDEQREEEINQAGFDCALEGSVWDATLLCGTPPLGSASSAFILTLIVLNLVIQAVFTYICVSSFTSENYTDATISAIRDWRRSVAHNYVNMDAITKKSMALRVCEGDPGLAMSTDQKNAFEELSSYLDHGIGPLMCTVSLVMWCLSISREVNRCNDIAHSVCNIPRSYRTVVTCKDGAYRIASVSVSRVRCVLAALACRFVISVIILGVGIIFLTQTVGLADLLLNAVALQFVVDVDELIFEALAPRSLRSMIDAAVPLVHPPLKRWRGLDLRAGITFVGLILVLSVVLPFGLFGHISLLRQARDALCGGELNFVYATDGAGAAWWTPSATPKNPTENELRWHWQPSWDEEDTPSFTSTMLDTVIEGPVGLCESDVNYCDLTGSGGNATATRKMREKVFKRRCCLRSQAKLPTLEGGQHAVQTKVTQSPEDASYDWNAMCLDLLDWPTSHLNRIRGTVGDAVDWRECDSAGCKFCCYLSFSKCSILSNPKSLFLLGPFDKPFCFNGECVQPTCAEHARFHCQNESIAGLRFRQLCPVSCGCDSPQSSLVLSLPAGGCGQCASVSQNYTDKMATLPCEDVSVNSSLWVDFLDHFELVSKFWPDAESSFAMVFIASLRTDGCETLSLSNAVGAMISTWKMDPCREWGEGGWGEQTKPLSIFCPAACGCRGGDPHCPDLCPENVTHWWHRST